MDIVEAEPDSPVPVEAEIRPRPARRSLYLGYFFAASSAILFSTKAIIIKLAYGLQIDAETLLALRMGLSLPVYFAVAAIDARDRIKKGVSFPNGRQILGALFVGLLGYWFASYTDFLGLEYISAQFERLILFTYPLFVVLFGAFFFGQKIRARALLAFALSYFGLALILVENLSTFGHDVVTGTAWVLAAAIAFAFYQLLAKEAIGTMGPRLFTCIAMTGAALGAFAQFFVFHPARDLLVGRALFGYGLLIAIAATVLPSFFLSAALHRISAQANSTIAIVSPMVTIILAAVVLGEKMSVVGLIGAALVFIGVSWFTLAEQKR